MADIGSAYLTIFPSMNGFAARLQSELSGVNVSSIGDRMGDQLGDGISDGMGRAANSTSGFSGRLSALSGAVMGVAGEIAGRLFDAVASLGGEMVEASDSAQKFASTLSFAGIDDSTISQLTQSTQEYADQTVYDLADIRNATAQLAANGVADYATLAEAAGNLNAVAGGNAETFRSVSMVMSQTAGSGRLMTENWNQLTDAIPGASGALQDAMRSAGAFEGNFREAMENGEISADEFFDAVQKLGMQDVAKEAATSTSTIEGAVGNLQASVVGLGSQVISSVTPMLTGAMTEISGFISDIPAKLAPIGNAIQTALSGGGTGDVGTAVTMLVNNFASSLVSGIQGLAAQLPAMMQTVIPIITTGITSLVTSVITQLPTILMSLLGLVVSGITSFVSSIAAQLPVILPQLAQAAMTAINGLVTQLLTNLPTYVGQMVQAAIQLFHGIVDAIPQVIPVVVQGIGDLVRNVLNNLPTFLTQMMEAAVELFTGIVEAIPEVVPAVLQGISDLLSQVWDAIAGFDLVSAGVEIMQGLINGIASMGQAVIDAIGGVVGGAIDWAKGLLGIASPSKVFAEIGDYTMQGLARGIEGGASGAMRALDAAVSDASERALSAIDAAIGDVSAAFDATETITPEVVPAATWSTTRLEAEAAATGADVADAVRDALAQMGVYLDSGLLVGGITPQMNRSLGRVQRRGSLA